MRIIGGLFIVVLVVIAGSQGDHISHYFLAWLIVGTGFMAGGIAGMLLSLPTFRRHCRLAGITFPTDEVQSERILARHMSFYGWNGAFIGAFLGVLFAMFVI